MKTVNNFRKDDTERVAAAAASGRGRCVDNNIIINIDDRDDDDADNSL